MQGRSQNFKKVPQNFTEGFKMSRKLLTLMTSQLMPSYRKTNSANKKKTDFSSIVITDVKLAS